MKVTTQIQCFCGTCANQTLHDCTCGLAAMERQKVAAALASGQTPDALIAAYMAEHGPQVRIVPEKRGLNLLGWWVPFLAAAAGLLALLGVLRGWQRRSMARAAEAPAGSSFRSEAERPYRDRLERDLKEFDA
jgi:cytochrome c-type biogenesis protein CcmH/NrfF